MDNLRNESIRPSARRILKIGIYEATLAVCIAISLNTMALACVSGGLSKDVLAMLGIDAVAFLFFGNCFGIAAARLIILKRYSYQLTGILCAWITLICTAAAHSVAENAFYYGVLRVDDAFGISVVAFVVGFIPSGIHGLLFGYRIFKKAQRL